VNNSGPFLKSLIWNGVVLLASYQQPCAGAGCLGASCCFFVIWKKEELGCISLVEYGSLCTFTGFADF
jgi:hypothetical protein